MKNMVFLVLAVALSGINLACEGDENQLDPSEFLTAKNFSSESLKFFIDNPGHELDGCVIYGGNCLPEVIVKPGVFTQMQLKNYGFTPMSFIKQHGSHFDERLMVYADEGSMARFETVHREKISYIVVKNNAGEILQVQPYRVE